MNIDVKNLYEFWGEKLHGELYKDGDCVVNLASEEYAKAVRKYLRPCDRFLDVVFLDAVKGRRRVVTTSAKMARGRMAQFILESGVKDVEELKGFEWDGFEYEADLSSSARYLFCR